MIISSFVQRQDSKYIDNTRKLTKFLEFSEVEIEIYKMKIKKILIQSQVKLIRLQYPDIIDSIGITFKK